VEKKRKVAEEIEKIGSPNYGVIFSTSRLSRCNYKVASATSESRITKICPIVFNFLNINQNRVFQPSTAKSENKEIHSLAPSRT